MPFIGMTLHEDLLKCIPVVGERHLYRDSSVNEIIHLVDTFFHCLKNLIVDVSFIVCITLLSGCIMCKTYMSKVDVHK